VNTDAPWPTPSEAEARVLRMQAKLYRWATDDPNRRFADLSNLVADPAFLLVPWRRVRGNRGARSAGIDGQTAYRSKPNAARRRSSPACGPIFGPARSARFRYASG
jgi:retron-type reverse transcriptase